MIYTIKLTRKFWFNTTLKKVKGHMFLSNVDQFNNPVSTPSGLMMVIFEDERRMFFNVNDYINIEFSDGWFKLEAQAAKIESQGKADLTQK